MILPASLFMSGCQKQEKDKIAIPEEEASSRFKNPGHDCENTSPEMVLRWNEAATNVVYQTQAIIPNPPIPPFIESRYYAKCKG